MRGRRWFFLVAHDVYIVYTAYSMAESIVFSFRTDKEIARRVEKQARLVPRLEGEKVLSRHEMAKALMIEALKAREQKEEEGK